MNYEEMRYGKREELDMAKMAQEFGGISYTVYTLKSKLEDLKDANYFPEEWIEKAVDDMIESLSVVDETAMSISNRFQELDNGEEL